MAYLCIILFVFLRPHSQFHWSRNMLATPPSGLDGKWTGYGANSQRLGLQGLIAKSQSKTPCSGCHRGDLVSLWG
jgi:hypothetical protein